MGTGQVSSRGQATLPGTLLQTVAEAAASHSRSGGPASVLPVLGPEASPLGVFGGAEGGHLSLICPGRADAAEKAQGGLAGVVTPGSRPATAALGRGVSRTLRRSCEKGENSWDVGGRRKASAAGLGFAEGVTLGRCGSLSEAQKDGA